MKQIEQQMTEVQKEEFKKIRDSIGWEIISKLAGDIIKDECSLEDVDEKLSPEEFKSECTGRKKAKKMFNRIFDDVNGVIEVLNKEKINYS